MDLLQIMGTNKWRNIFCCAICMHYFYHIILLFKYRYSELMDYQASASNSQNDINCIEITEQIYK